MTDFFRKLYELFIDRLSHIAAGAQTFPRRIWNTLRKPETKKVLIAILVLLLELIVFLLLVTYLLNLLLNAIVFIINYYGIYILGIAILFIKLRDWQKKKAMEREEQMMKQQQREQQALYKKAEPTYIYLRNALFILLTDHFCQLTELCRPLTPNLLTETPHFEVVDGVIFYFFRIDKQHMEPLTKGSENVSRLLQSVLTRQIETQGIEGICPANTDPLCSVISVHKVNDLGSFIRISLVLDSEAYQNMKEKLGNIDYSSNALIEHIQ